MRILANDQLVLQINKINISPDKSYVKYNQNERGKVIDINVIDNDGINAYDLTNKKIRFVDDKEDNKLVLDDEADNPGHFTRTADAQGKFSYIFHDLVYQRSGIARFEIYTDSEHIDATANFEIQIENTGSLVAANESYISSLEGLVAHYHSTVDTTASETQQLINSLTDKINQAISNGQRDVANQLTDMRNQLQALHNQENGLIQSWTNDFNARKADFDKLKADWQAQSKTISDSYASKIAEINSQAQSQHDQIQTAADQQLQANQSASDAELAKIKSDAQAQHDQIEKAKTDAIAEINSQRDAAINQANSDFKAKIDALQTDYDAWKSTTLADFTKQLADIKTNISNDQSTLKDFDQRLDYTKQELADMAKQLDSLDFTKFVTGDQFKEAMSKKASGIKVQGLGGDYIMAVDPSSSLINAANGSGALADTGVIGAALQVVADAILDKNHYTKDEVDKMVNDAKTTIMNTVNTKANALAQQIGDLQTENSNLKNVNAQLQQQNDNLQKQVTKLTPVHVTSEADVANQDAHFVIADD